MNQREIAKLANVSSATVSRVVNRDPRVAPKTAARVRAIIEKYGYVHNTVARNLRINRTNTIGFLIPDINNPFFPSVLQGIESICAEKQYSLVLQHTGENISREIIAINTLMASRVDGLAAVIVDADGQQLESCNRMQVPVVVIDRRVQGHIYDTVTVDNRHGMHMAIEHLVQLGHEKIAAIYGVLSITPGIERFEGYRESLHAFGLKFRPEYMVGAEFDEVLAYKRMRELLRLPDPPTAVITANNMMTMGAFKALRDANMAVPQEISLIGFDDFPMAGYVDPPITVVKRPTEEMGIIAGKMLFRRILGGGPVVPEEVILPVEFLVRSTCGPPFRK